MVSIQPEATDLAEEFLNSDFPTSDCLRQLTESLQSLQVEEQKMTQETASELESNQTNLNTCSYLAQ